MKIKITKKSGLNHSRMDSYSFIHFAYGLNLSIYLSIISRVYMNYNSGIIVSFLIAIGFIIGWEILENMIIGGSLKESNRNIIFDIIIGFSTFFMTFMIFYTLGFELLIVIFVLITVLTLFMLYILKFSKYKTR